MKDNKEKKNHPTNPLESDADIQKLLDTWDIVTCYICGKEISMLDANIVYDSRKNREYFICKKAH